MAWHERFHSGPPPRYQPRYDRFPGRNDNRRNSSLQALDALDDDALYAYISNRLGTFALHDQGIVPERSPRSSIGGRGFHRNRNAGHAYGDPVIDGYGTTVLGNMTQYYILPGSQHRAAQVTGPRERHASANLNEGRDLRESHQDQWLAFPGHARNSQFGQRTSPDTRDHKTSTISQQSSKMVTATDDLALRSPDSWTPQYMPPPQYPPAKRDNKEQTPARSRTMTDSSNIGVSALSWRESAMNHLQLTHSSINPSSSKILLHVTAGFHDFDRSYNPKHFDCFSDHCHVKWVHSTVDATDSLKASAKPPTAVFIKEFSFTKLTEFPRYRLLNALLHYTSNGGTTVFHGWEQGPGVNDFLNKISLLPWRAVQGDPSLKRIEQNPTSWVKLPGTAPKTLRRAAYELQNVATEDLLYGASDQPHRGPFAMTQYGKGRIGWFGDTFSDKELQTILLSMLGLLEDDAVPTAAAHTAPSRVGSDSSIVTVSTPGSEATRDLTPTSSASFDYRDYRELYEPD